MDSRTIEPITDLFNPIGRYTIQQISHRVGIHRHTVVRTLRLNNVVGYKINNVTKSSVRFRGEDLNRVFSIKLVKFAESGLVDVNDIA